MLDLEERKLQEMRAWWEAMHERKNYKEEMEAPKLQLKENW